MTDNSSHRSRRWLKFFIKTGSAICLALFLLGVIGIACGQWWAKNNLAPILQQELSKSLKRPVRVGEIEDIWLNHIRIGNTLIPTNGSELNSLAVRNIVVSFNPFRLALDRTLKLDIDLVAPSIYLPQDEHGNWVNIPAQPKTPPGAVKVEIGKIKIDDAKIILVPYSKTPRPIDLNKINIEVDLNNSKHRVDFTAGGQFEENGRFRLEGNSLVNGGTQITVKGEKLDAAAATRIFKIPEVEIASGTVDGNLNLAFQAEKYLKISSKLLVHDGNLIINHVPRSLAEINGEIEVSDRAVKFNNVTTKYDRVAGVVNGSLDYTTGYKLTAKTSPISLPDVFKSIDVKSPFPLVGAATAELQLTGKLDRPILAGKFQNSQPSQIDRVKIDRVNGNFKLADGRINIDAIATPKLGGKITTQGEIQLLKTPQTRFQLHGDRLPADALSSLYGAKLPPQVKLGNASVTGTIGGAGANIYTNLLVNTPQANYPGSVDLQITPQGKTIVREANIRAAGGKVNVTGEVNATNWRLKFQPQGVDTRQLAKIAGVVLPANCQGKLAGNILATGLNTEFRLDRIQAQGGLNLQLAAGKINVDRITLDGGKWRANVSSESLDLLQLGDASESEHNSQALTLTKGSPEQNSSLPKGIVSGNFELSGNGLEKFNVNNILAKGRGKVQLDAGSIESQNLTIVNGNWQGAFTTDNLQIAKLNPQLRGRLNGKLNLAGNINEFTPDSIRGTGRGVLDLPQGKIVGNNLQIDRGKWQGNLIASSLRLGGLAPEIPLKYQNARLDGNVNVAGDLQNLKPEAITIVGDGKLNLDGESILARQLDIKAGKWRGNFTLDRFNIGSINEDLPTLWKSGRVNGNFAMSGDLNNFDPARLQVAGTGELNLNNGQIRAKNLKLDRGNWSSNLEIFNLKLGDVNNQLSSQLQTGKLTGKINIVGNIVRSKPSEIQAKGGGKIKLLNGGEIVANNLQLAAGQWQSDIAINGLRLGAINRDLPAPIQQGLLSGNFQTAGNLQSPGLERIKVIGTGNIQDILGGKISLNNIDINNGQLSSKVVADRLNIGELAKFAPKNSIDANLLSGKLNADWQISGNLLARNPANFQVLGETKLTNLKVGKLKFDPNLIGNISVNPGRGVDINFTGITDRLALSLDRNLQIQSFNLDRQGIIVKGVTTGDSTLKERRILDINVEQFPIALLQQWIPKSVGIQQYRLDGNATGNLAVNLANFQVKGDRIAIAKPIFGAFEGDRLLTNFQYANGRLELNDTEIQRGTNTYQLNASIDPGAKTPTFQAQLQIPKGSLADARNLFQIFSVADLAKPLNQRKYGKAADLYPHERTDDKIANRPQPLYNELRRISELRQWLNRETELQQTNAIPDLGNLQGDFSGKLTISSSPQIGLKADFNIVGADWQLDRYRLNKIQATGNWQNGQLRLEPLAIAIKDSQMTISGNFGVKNQNGKIDIKNFPAKWFANFTGKSVDIEGSIDLSAQVRGNIGNPQIDGNLAINDGQLNQTKLQYASGNFNYADGRLNFDSNATFIKNSSIDRDDSIKIAGSIPYQLPFTIKAPISNVIKADLILQNRGLQILDILSKKQLQWIDGQGKIAVRIDGKIKPSGEIATLSANGKATIANGIIQSIAIPEALKNINSEIVFDFDRIDIEKFEGKFDRGQVSVTGIIPIADSFSIEPSKQLNILMKGVAIDLKEKYSGNVDADINAIGTAFKPIITGNLKLSNGQIFLPDTESTTKDTILGIKPPAVNPTSDSNNLNSIQLRNLRITLGDNFQITRAPILNFVATGNIDLDGTLNNPRPFGQVQLQKGAVNIFTTQFRLASGPQTADFFPTLGAEPVLNIRLYSKILESTSSLLSQRNSIARSTNGSEINQPAQFYTTSLGSVQTVQVEARIAGLASQLTQRLELTSTPSLTQAEIVLLLGGGIVQQIGTGENIGLGLVNLAGSSIINNVQDRISDLLNLSDFRLFPTIIKDSKTSNPSTLGIAAEVGTELTPKISASVFKILTNSEPLFYSLRYRINDQLLLRGSTNLFGENRTILEFEQRF